MWLLLVVFVVQVCPLTAEVAETLFFVEVNEWSGCALGCVGYSIDLIGTALLLETTPRSGVQR